MVPAQTADVAIGYLYAINDLYPTVQGEGALTGIPMVLVRLHGCPVGCHFCDTKHTWGGLEPLTKHEVEGAGGRVHVARDIKLDENRSRRVPFGMDEAGRMHTWCGDTDAWASAEGWEIATLARKMGPAIKWAMLTGGEPAAQSLAPLVDALHKEGFRVALETSGTADGHVERWSRYTEDDRALSAGPQWSVCDWTTVSPKLGNPAHRPILLDALRGADEVKFVIGRVEDFATMEEALYEWTEAGAISTECKVSVQPMSAGEKATALCVSYAIRRGISVSIQVHKIMAVR